MTDLDRFEAAWATVKVETHLHSEPANPKAGTRTLSRLGYQVLHVAGVGGFVFDLTGRYLTFWAPVD